MPLFWFLKNLTSKDQPQLGANGPEEHPGLLPPKQVQIEPQDRFLMSLPNWAQKAWREMRFASRFISRGEDPRDYQKLKRWESHLERNKANIREAARDFLKSWREEGLGDRRPHAVVWGVGKGFDIDLADLSRDFDLTLVDARESALNVALGRIPWYRRPGVTLIPGDATGGAVSELYRNLSNNLGNPGVFDYILKNAEREIPKTPDISQQISPVPDFVVSSMLLSQFIPHALSELEAEFIACIREKPPEEKRMLDAEFRRHTRLFEGTHWATLQGLLINKHMDEVAGWVEEGAWAYVATDVELQEQISEKGFVSRPLLFDADGRAVRHIRQTLPARRRVVRRDLNAWQWDYAKGVRMGVEAMVLTPQMPSSLALGAAHLTPR